MAKKVDVHTDCGCAGFEHTSRRHVACPGSYLNYRSHRGLRSVFTLSGCCAMSTRLRPWRVMNGSAVMLPAMTVAVPRMSRG